MKHGYISFLFSIMTLVFIYRFSSHQYAYTNIIE
ncbi:hypothetical protein BO443_60242 [Burkholderia orbicola]